MKNMNESHFYLLNSGSLEKYKKYLSESKDAFYVDLKLPKEIWDKLVKVSERFIKP